MRNKPERHSGVIAYPCPYAGKIGDGLDIERFQISGRSDAGAHQDRRGIDRTSTQNDAFGVFGLAIRGLDADGTFTIEQDTVDELSTLNRQVLTATGALDVRQQCRYAARAEPVHGQWCDAAGLQSIVVGNLGKTGGTQRLVKRALQGDQLRFAIAHDRHRAVTPMVRADAVRVSFKPLVERRDLLPPPFRVSEPLPEREIRRAAPLEDGCIHCGRTADDLAAQKTDTPTFDGCDRDLPVMCRATETARVAQVRWQRSFVRVVGTSLEKSDRFIGVLGKARSQNSAG